MQRNIGDKSLKLSLKISDKSQKAIYTTCWQYQIIIVMEREKGQSLFCEMSTIVTNSTCLTQVIWANAKASLPQPNKVQRPGPKSRKTPNLLHGKVKDIMAFKASHFVFPNISLAWGISSQAYFLSLPISDKPLFHSRYFLLAGGQIQFIFNMSLTIYYLKHILSLPVSIRKMFFRLTIQFIGNILTTSRSCPKGLTPRSVTKNGMYYVHSLLKFQK